MSDRNGYTRAHEVALLRRTALNTLAALAASTSASGAIQPMAMRNFGRTSEKVSAIGLGGYQPGIPKDPATAVRIVRTAVDGGMTFMDNCWDYQDGESERKMGVGL